VEHLLQGLNGADAPADSPVMIRFRSRDRWNNSTT